MRVLHLDEKKLRILTRHMLEESQQPVDDAIPEFNNQQRQSQLSSYKTPGIFTPWSSFYTNPADATRLYKRLSSGQGHGEQFLQKIFGGTLGNPYDKYDLMIDDGEEWEIKEPDDTGRIVYGVSGRSLCTSFMRELEVIAEQCAKYYNKLNRADEADAARSISQAIRGGELGQTNLSTLKNLVREARAASHGKNDIQSFKYTFTFNTETQSIEKTLQTPSVQMSRKLSSLLLDDDGGAYIDANASLVHDIFNLDKDSDEWFKDEIEKLSPEKACEVVGFFFVSEQGFFCVRREQLAQYLTFLSVTRNRLRYRISDNLASRLGISIAKRLTQNKTP